MNKHDKDFAHEVGRHIANKSKLGSMTGHSLPFEKGQRVLVVGGAWAGFSGEYVGPEQTLVGILHKVDLDNGMGTLVPLYQIRKGE